MRVDEDKRNIKHPFIAEHKKTGSNYLTPGYKTICEY